MYLCRFNVDKVVKMVLRELRYKTIRQTGIITKGGATVLKVGGGNFASGASEKIFLTPHLTTTWGYRNKYGCTKFAHRNGIMN